MAAPTPTGDAELDELLAQQQRFLSGEEAPAAQARRVTGSRAAGGLATGAASEAPGSLRPTLQELAPGSGASPEVITQALRDAALEPRPGGRGAGTGAYRGAAATSHAARPAASVTRVPGGRSNPAPAGVSHVDGIARGAAPGEPSAPSVAGSVPPPPPVLGDILERTSSEVPKPPSAPQLPHGRGFPAALHRSQRPFGAAPLAAGPSAPAPQTVAQAAPVRMEPSMSASMDGSSIEAEVQSRLAAMTPSDVDSALEELRERLAPDKLAFLQRRGQQRRQGAARQDGAAAREPAALAPAPRAPVAPVAPLYTDKAAHQQAAPATQPNGAAAVRFTLAGQLLPPEQQGAAVLPPAGLSRDPLRMEGDPAAGGYTLADVVMLCRSAVPAQRVAGLRGLACCVRAIRAGMAQHELGSAACAPPAPGVSWAAVYVHAVKAQRLALLLRTALDDSATSAIAAAAAAAAALVADVHEELLWEAADGNVVGISSSAYGDNAGGALVDSDDAASCRRHPSQPHCRTRAGAPWDPVVPWHGTAADSGKGDDQGDQAVETDASDPCQALLRMSVVARVRFLLEAAQHGGAAHALLQLLLALARHSPPAAQAVAATPRMMLTLRTCFIEATPPGGVAAETLDDDSDGAASGTALLQPRQPPEFWHCRPLAVQLLRTLVECGGAPAAAAAAQEGLIDACVARFVPVPMALGAPASGDVTDAGEAATHGAVLRREALRLWRGTVRADPGLAPLVESYFGALVPCLQPPTAHGSARVGPWEVCRDVFRLLAATQGADAPQGHGLSQPAAAAVVAAALRWATPDAVRSVTARPEDGTSGVALAALAAVLHFLHKCAPDNEALSAATGLAQADVADVGPLRCLLAALAKHDVLRSDAAACGAALASVSLCHALLALLRRGVAPLSAAAAQPPGDVTCTAAARHVAQVMSAALDAVLAPLAARDDASKEAWGPAAQRAVVAALCSAQAAALCALTAPGGGGVASILSSPLDAAESRRVVLAATHVVGAAPPGGDATVRRVIDGVVTPAVMTSLCTAGLQAASTAASVVGSAAHEEVLSSGNAGAAALPMPPRPPIRGACRARLHAAAGLKPDGASSSVSGSRLPAPGWWPFRALGLASGASDWAIDAATGASVSLAVDSAQQEVSATLLTLLMALESPHLADGAPVPAAVRLRLLGGVFGASSDGVLRHPAARLTCAALTDAYTCSLRLDAASNSDDDTDPLVAESSATDLVQRFADASFGDPLHGRHVALALRLRCPARARVAALHALLDKQVAHLLPPLSAFQFHCADEDAHAAATPAAEVLFLAPDGEQSPQMLRMWVDFLTSGRDFERAAAAGALPAAMATHAVRCALRELSSQAPPGEAVVVPASAGEAPPRRAALQALAKAVASGGPEPLRSEAASALLPSQKRK